jgi:hypothetical protein
MSNKTDDESRRRLREVQTAENFDLADYILVTVKVPVMYPTKSDEDFYNLFKNNMILLLKVDYFFPIALNFIMTQPTFIVWTISNFLQVIEI